MRILFAVFAAVALLSCASNVARGPAGAGKKVLDSSGYLYDPSDRSCDGYPRLQVETMPGTCLGLVLGKDRLKDSSGKPFVMPRTILRVKDSDDMLLTVMGGWHPNNGGLYWLRKTGQGYDVVELKTKLNMPHGLHYGPDGFIYIGETHMISRFQFSGGKLSNWQVAVKQMPRAKEGMHPLTEFAFDYRTGDLFVNAGAPTDHCFAKEEKGGYVDCPDTEAMGLGSVMKYPAAEIKRGNAVMNSLVAKGLRNSMGMIVGPYGHLIQGENGRDFPELEEPYEEINVIPPGVSGLNFGWPQCYDFHAVSPEWVYKEGSKTGLRKAFDTWIKCDQKESSQNPYKKPWALIPPHASPLHMKYYDGQMFPALGGKLLMAWHGYQPPGHRLVAYAVDNRGRPVVKAPDAEATFKFDVKGGCPVEKKFSPRGGLDVYAPYTEVISGWDKVKDIRPLGTPLGFEFAQDGSIFIVEDKNDTVVRLAATHGLGTSGGDCANKNAEVVDPRIEMLAWRHAIRSNPAALAGYEQVNARLIQTYCAGCHGWFKASEIAADKFQTLDFFIKNDYIVPGDSAKSRIVGAITQDGSVKPMPPAGEKQFGSDAASLVGLVRGWIDSLPKDVDGSYVKIEVGSARQIRNGTADKTALNCGTIPAGDSIWVEPRQRVNSDGWTWTKIYLLPRDSRLIPGKCAPPEDGVYWMKLKKL